MVTKSYSGGNLAQHERVTYGYDATGTWDTTTRTEYLVDHRNFTGYQQVIKETVYDDQGNVVKTIEYNFGHDEISQTVTEFDAAGQITAKHTEIFGHDGHGSVKVLYDAAAAILQVFTYEAYGQMLAVHNSIATVVTTGALTSLQYNGEQFDSRPGGTVEQGPIRVPLASCQCWDEVENRPQSAPEYRPGQSRIGGPVVPSNDSHISVEFGMIGRVEGMPPYSVRLANKKYFP